MGLFKFAAPPDLVVVSAQGTETGRVSGIDTHKSNVPKPASKITVPKPGNKQIVRNRVTGDSKAGRKLRAQNSTSSYYPPEPSSEIAKWNAEVEARKAAKALAKISRGKE